MALTGAEARLRLAYINHYRELVLGVLLALVISLRVLGNPVSWITLLLFLVWFLLACAFVRVSSAAARLPRLYATAGVYFLAEILLITGIAWSAHHARWLALLFLLISVLHAHMVLPRRAALALTAAAALGLVFLQALDLGLFRRALSLGDWIGLAAILALVYVIGGLSIAQFAQMLGRQTEALQTANRDLNSTSHELRLHRDHLEDLVRQRTRDLEVASAELRRKNEELGRLSELKSSFLANVSHELRTPLTSIRSFSELLLRYPDEDAATRGEFLGIICNECGRLTRLIDDVLDLARIEAGRLELHSRPLRLADLMRETLELFQPLAVQKGLTLECDVGAGLPPLIADPDRLRQVFTNLLSNALKFTEQGGIAIGACVQDREMLMHVADTGLGLPPGDAELMFEKFGQHREHLDHPSSGSGLGLAICREICLGHGGRIWAERRPAGGSIFYVALPLAPAAALAVRA
ncbi:MAG: sensor histidine kinase [Terriglobales bacterium]